MQPSHLLPPVSQFQHKLSLRPELETWWTKTPYNNHEIQNILHFSQQTLYEKEAGVSFK
jgi:hypothetical protein